MTTRKVVAHAAERLRGAVDAGTPCAPVRDLIGSDDVETAYAVQEANARHRVDRGARPTGRKIGLTSVSVQSQFGVGQPDFGVLFADMIVADGDPLDLGGFLQPRIEAEIAFVLGDDINNPHASIVDVLRATEFLLPAIEVVDSRISDWDITIADTIADNASSGAVVLGTTPYSPTGLDLTEVAMTLQYLGQPVSTGVGAACLNSPTSAVAWLAREVSRRGAPLRAGEVVLSGALGPMVPVEGPGRYRADLSALGHVEAVFTTSGASR